MRTVAVRAACSLAARRFLAGLVQTAVVVGVGLLAGSGCRVDQAEEVAKYRDVLGGPEIPATSIQEGETLSLAKAMQLANAHNEQLAIQGEDYLQALINKTRATANFLPKVSLVPLYIRRQNPNFPASSGIPSDFFPPEATDVPLDAQVNINVPADIAYGKRVQSVSEQQRNLLLNLKQNILLDVAQVYYQVLISEAQVNVLEHSVSVREKTLDDTRARYEVGLADKLAVTQIEAQLAQTKVQLIQARTDVANGRATLALLTGVGFIAGTLQDTQEAPEEAPAESGLVATAWLHRHDLQASQQAVQAAVHALQMAWSQYFPDVSIDFSYFLSRQSFPSDVLWSSTFQANMPIFSAGLIRADVRTAWSQLRQAKLSQSYLQRQIEEQLKIALDNFKQGHKKIQELKYTVTSAQTSVNQAEDEYKVGRATNLDRLDAQDTLLNAQLDSVSAKFTEKVYYLELARAIGRLGVEALEPGFKLVDGAAGADSGRDIAGGADGSDDGTDTASDGETADWH